MCNIDIFIFNFYFDNFNFIFHYLLSTDSELCSIQIINWFHHVFLIH